MVSRSLHSTLVATTMLVLWLLGPGLTGAQTQADSGILLSYQREAEPPQVATPQPPTQPDRAVRLAGFESAASEQEVDHTATRLPVPPDARQLAPQSRVLGPINPFESKPSADGAARAIPQIESLATAGTGLAIVVGLFLVCMWLMRHSGPKPTTPLPKEAVAVLGRVPLAARNFAHLLQVGNKLVLVAVTPEGVAPITEVTEPVEVDRLLGMCLRSHKHSSTAEFQHVLQQLASEPAKGFLGNEAQSVAARIRR
ncbi:MAG: flagellar biosynthetic protein FliO [Planctomycetales bacterium]|nr:flagellar biosynthetic protein FliO [Planctomycetales bacterium]